MFDVHVICGLLLFFGVKLSSLGHAESGLFGSGQPYYLPDYASIGSLNYGKTFLAKLFKIILFKVQL